MFEAPLDSLGLSLNADRISRRGSQQRTTGDFVISMRATGERFAGTRAIMQTSAMAQAIARQRAML